MTQGRFFEDFRLGETLVHACPRTITLGDLAMNQALYGNRFVLQSSDAFARACGLPQAPADDLITFHMVLGKSVSDVSVNAVANLGYAEGRFGAPVYPGDTLSAESEVIGLKQNSNGETGVVWVRTIGRKQTGEEVLRYARWVMVRKRDRAAPAPETVIPDLADHVAADALPAGPPLDRAGWNAAQSGSDRMFEDFAVGDVIDHVDGQTVEEAEHQLATRLWQNPAKVHFDAKLQEGSIHGRRLVFGGHVISIARAASVNGLANACSLLAINSGSHANPCFAGDTVYARSEVMEKADLAAAPGFGALRLRLLALKDHGAGGPFSLRDASGRYDSAVLLDFNIWVKVPKR